LRYFSLEMNRIGTRLVNTVVSSRGAVQSNANARTVLFPEETVVETPSFEFTRFISSSFSQNIYSIFFEKTFSTQSLLIGANDGLSLSCSYIVSRNWDRLSSIASNQLIHSLQSVRDGLSNPLLCSLSFSSNDVLYSFVYRSFFTGNKIFNVSKSGNLFIYYLIVSYVRKSENVPHGLRPSLYLTNHRTDVSVANVGFCRAVNPLGKWKMTHLNISL
ncbi:hypothetical protein PFISCL1PPCAC_15585, partial [Pristionchus fissidentatus]